MALTLSNGAITVNLPGDLQWIDEYNWNKVKNQVDVTLDGSLVVQTSTQQAGRPITLKGGDDFAWMSKEEIDDLFQLVDAGDSMTLTLNDGRQFTVRFRYEEGAVRATRVAPGIDKYNNITINLREV